MSDKSNLFNPFPGLRSFRSDEDHLFFGREEQTLELMARLERNRFIAVVGSSGRGKSSLVRCGLLSRLQGGGMAAAGAHWAIAVMHPGGDPLRHLAEALLDAGLYERADENAVPHLLATLGRSQFGLVEAVRQAALPAGTNFLLVVDQFEEIFRYDEAGATESEVANDFIAMLREACAQSEVPVYVVATMRSDFIGDCSRFEGLAEAVNRGEYLIPRLSREQFKSAIEGPIRVAGGRITPRLLQRLLNDVGEEQDQLPCLQHALMRTWRVWQARADAEALDLEDYAQVGRMSQALSLHADEVTQSLATERQRELCAAMFKALTVEGSEKRGIRRPRRLQMLCRILEVEPAELRPVIDAFRQPEVSFLMPPADVELRDATVIDLSHESLMRVWTRLRGWVDEEAQSVGIFRRLSESAALWRQGRTGLCRDPELSIARAWREANRPNAAWAEQYEGSFDEAMAYLQASTEAAEAERCEQEERARAAAARQMRRQRFLIAGLASAVVALLIGAFFGIRAQRRAEQRAKAEAARASQTDFVLGSRLLDEGKLSEGLAYLVRSGRKDPANPLVAPRLLSVLTSHNFLLPAGVPLALPSPGIAPNYTADGQRIVVQCEDWKVRVINTAGWQIERELQFPAAIRRYGIRLPQNNSRILAAWLSDNTIAVCDVATGQLLHRLKPPEGLVAGEFSPDGAWLAVNDRRDVWVWNAGTGELLAKFPDDFGSYHGVVFRPDSRALVTTHGAGVAQVWSLPDGTAAGPPIRPANANSSWIYPAFTPDGSRLAFAAGVANAGGGKFSVYDVATGAELWTMPSTEPWWNFWLTADGNGFILAGANKVTVTDIKTGRPRGMTMTHGGPYRAAQFLPDKGQLFMSSADGMIRVWDVETGTLAAEPAMRQPQFTPAAITRDGNEVAAFTRDGRVYRLRPGRGAVMPLGFPRNTSHVLVNMGAALPARLVMMTAAGVKAYDLASGKRVEDFQFPKPIVYPTGSFRSTYGGTLGPNDMLPVQTEPVGQPPVWHVWAVGDDRLVHDVILDDVPPGVAVFRVTPGVNFVPAFDEKSTGTWLGIWDMRTGSRVATIQRDEPAFLGAGRSPVISPDDKRIAYTAADLVVHVCDIATGKEVCVLRHEGKESIVSYRFLADSERIVSGDDWGGVHIWSAASGRLLQSTQAHRAQVHRIDFSYDGRYFATCSRDGAVQVWDMVTCAPVGTPLVQAGYAARIDFSHVSKRIVTPSSTGTARVWDLETGQPLTELLDNEGGSVGVIAFSPDDRFIECHGSTRTGQQLMRIWPVPPDGHGRTTPDWLLRLATICAGQRLSDETSLVNATGEFAGIEQIRQTLAAAPADDPYAEWGRWFLSDDSNRPIAPGFTITPAEAQKLHDEYYRAATANATTTTTTP